VSLRNRLKRQLKNREFRHAYADEHLNLSISTQIKIIRENQNMSQATLAGKIGTKQAGISRIESANYDGWSIALLRRLAEAFDLRLHVTFEEFGTLWKEVDNFNRESLHRRAFDDDPEFEESTATAHATVAQRSNIVPASTPRYWREVSAVDSQSDLGQIERMPVGAAGSASVLERCA
jgi:transcriptional regulator with XRE-family HTH domain